MLSLNAIDIHRVKRVIDDAGKRLGHVSAVPKPVRQRIPQLHAGVVLAVIHIADGSDQTIRLLVDNPPAAGFICPIAAHHVFAVILGFAQLLLRRPKHVAGDLLVAAVRKNILRVAHGDPAKDEPFRFKRRHRKKPIFIGSKHILTGTRSKSAPFIKLGFTFFIIHESS